MKIACVADLHLGAGPDLHPGRLDHQAEMWAAMNEQMRDEGATVLLVAGDVFHRRKPTPAEYLAFTRGWSFPEERTVIISGNHDAGAMSEASAVEVLDPQQYFDTVATVPARLDVGVEVAVLPWTPAAHFRAQHEHDPALADQPVADLLMEAARGLRAECLTEHPILLAHWSISGARTPSGMSVDEFREPVLPAVALAEMGWGAVIAGHIHTPTVLAEPNVMFCGSPWLIDYGEALVKHGWWLLEGDPETGWTRRYVETPLEHRFVTHDLDMIDTDGYPQLSKAWSVRDAVVRVRIRCSEAQAAELDVAAMRRSLVEEHGALHVYQIQVNVERSERRRGQVEMESLSPDDALELWLGQENERGALSVDVWPAHTRFMEEVHGG